MELMLNLNSKFILILYDGKRQKYKNFRTFGILFLIKEIKSTLFRIVTHEVYSTHLAFEWFASSVVNESPFYLYSKQCESNLMNWRREQLLDGELLPCLYKGTKEFRQEQERIGTLIVHKVVFPGKTRFIFLAFWCWYHVDITEKI